MFIFTFKKTSAKNGQVHTFTGTWKDFEDKYPQALLVSPIEPVEE